MVNQIRINNSGNNKNSILDKIDVFISNLNLEKALEKPSVMRTKENLGEFKPLGKRVKYNFKDEEGLTFVRALPGGRDLPKSWKIKKVYMMLLQINLIEHYSLMMIVKVKYLLINI